MNRYALFIGIALALMLYGCSNEPKADEENNEKTEQTTQDNPKENEKITLEKAGKQVDTQLTKGLESSLKNQDKEVFLQLFSKRDELFYKEQKRST